jgi:hypothetical protein
MPSETIDPKKLADISRQLKAYAKDAFGDFPKAGNNIGVLRLYAPGTCIGYQPDGVAIKYEPSDDSLTYHELVMENGKLVNVSSHLVAPINGSSPKNRILRAIATKNISQEQMEYFRSQSTSSKGGRFTDWNQELMVDAAEKIFRKSNPDKVGARSVSGLSELFDMVC